MSTSDKGLFTKYAKNSYYSTVRKQTTHLKSRPKLEETPYKEDAQIANKHINNISYVIRQMQIQTRYHYSPIRMAKIQNTDNTKCYQVCGATAALIHCWWECKLVQTLWKRVWQFLTVTLTI